MKKNIIIITITLLSVSMYSQDIDRIMINDVLIDMARLRPFYYEPNKTVGTAYINNNFLPATVGDLKGNALVRYDVHNDEFEFVKGKDTLLLYKDAKFGTITFANTGTKYKLIEYNKKGKLAQGYLIWLFEKNNVTLFKKQNISFTNERLAKTSFETNQPAKFERGKDTYFFKDNDKPVFEFPSNKKGLLKLYPEKKTEIESFIKQNNIDFEKESDIIKLIEFLAV